MVTFQLPFWSRYILEDTSKNKSHVLVFRCLSSSRRRERGNDREKRERGRGCDGAVQCNQKAIEWETRMEESEQTVDCVYFHYTRNPSASQTCVENSAGHIHAGPPSLLKGSRFP